MRKILEMILSIITSTLIGIWVMTFIFQETEIARFLCGEILIALTIYIILFLLFSVAEAREERKRKLIQRREQNEKNSKHTIKTTVE